MSEQDIHEIKRALVDNVPLSVTDAAGAGGGGAKWNDGSVTTLLSTELNSLGSGSRAQTSAFDNDTGLDIYADLELLVGFATVPAAGDNIAQVWLLPSLDGTNFPDPTESTPPFDPPPGLLAGVFTAAHATTAAQRLFLPGVVLPPRDMKFVLKNTDATAYVASGNTLRIRPYQLQAP